MNLDAIQGILRAVLAAIGGYLVGHGMADTGVINDGIGAILALTTVAWSLIHKAQAAQAKDDAVNAAIISMQTQPLTSGSAGNVGGVS